MARAPFRFKQFTIAHDACAMPLNTDGILLGSWAQLPQNGNALDIGTGCGILALQMAQRSNALHIMGIDIDAKSVGQAKENVKGSFWSDRIAISETDIKKFAPLTLFNCILCNPPYFEHSLKNPDVRKSNARHANALTFDSLVASMHRLLAVNGTCAVIVPFDASKRIEQLVAQLDGWMMRRCLVRSLPNKPVSRVLLEFSFGKEKHPTIEESLSIHKEGSNYSDAYRALTSAFYL